MQVPIYSFLSMLRIVICIPMMKRRKYQISLQVPIYSFLSMHRIVMRIPIRKRRKYHISMQVPIYSFLLMHRIVICIPMMKRRKSQISLQVPIYCCSVSSLSSVPSRPKSTYRILKAARVLPPCLCPVPFPSPVTRGSSFWAFCPVDVKMKS